MKVLPANDVRVAAFDQRHSAPQASLLSSSLSLTTLVESVLKKEHSLFDFLAEHAERMRADDEAAGRLMTTYEKTKRLPNGTTKKYVERANYAADKITSTDVYFSLLCYILGDASLIGRNRFWVVWHRVGAGLSASDVDEWTSSLFSHMRTLVRIGSVFGIDDLLYPYRPKSMFELTLLNPSKPNPKGVGGDGCAVKLDESRKSFFIRAILHVEEGAKMSCPSTMLEMMRLHKASVVNVSDSGFITLDGLVQATQLSPPSALLGSIKKDNLPSQIVTLGSRGLSLHEVRVIEFIYKGARVAASFKSIKSDYDEAGLKRLNQPRRDFHIIVTTAHTVGVPVGVARALPVSDTPFTRDNIESMAKLDVSLLKNLCLRFDVPLPRLNSSYALAMALCGVVEQELPREATLPSYEPPSTRAHASSDEVAQWDSVTEEEIDSRTIDALKSWCKMLGVKYQSKFTKGHFKKALLDAKRRATSTTSPSVPLTWLKSFTSSTAPASSGHLHTFYNDEMNVIDNVDEHMGIMRPKARLRGNARRALVVNTMLITVSNMMALWCENLASRRIKLPSTRQFVDALYKQASRRAH